MNGKSPQQRAKLRVCASCEWLYNGNRDCPVCGFASYGARFAYGDICYKYKRTQKPWEDKRIARFLYRLRKTKEYYKKL